MIAGPNGAGKSTFYELRIKPALRNIPFINADNIQRDELKTPSPEAAYGAAKIAEQQRQSHIEDKRSFITETTFSHPSKLELLDQASREEFRIIVYHISVGSADLAVARVKNRVEEGGHNVPETKIRERYDRNQALIRRAVLKADMAFVYDNSKFNQPQKTALYFERGRIIRTGGDIPDWATRLYQAEIRIYQQLYKL